MNPFLSVISFSDYVLSAEMREQDRILHLEHDMCIHEISDADFNKLMKVYSLSIDTSKKKLEELEKELGMKVQGFGK